MRTCVVCGCPINKDTFNTIINGETGDIEYLCDFCYEVEEMDLNYQQTLTEEKH